MILSFTIGSFLVKYQYELLGLHTALILSNFFTAVGFFSVTLISNPVLMMLVSGILTGLGGSFMLIQLYPVA